VSEMFLIFHQAGLFAIKIVAFTLQKTKTTTPTIKVSSFYTL